MPACIPLKHVTLLHRTLARHEKHAAHAQKTRLRLLDPLAFSRRKNQSFPLPKVDLMVRESSEPLCFSPNDVWWTLNEWEKIKWVGCCARSNFSFLNYKWLQCKWPRSAFFFFAFFVPPPHLFGVITGTVHLIRQGVFFQNVELLSCNSCQAIWTISPLFQQIWLFPFKSQKGRPRHHTRSVSASEPPPRSRAMWLISISCIS